MLLKRFLSFFLSFFSSFHIPVSYIICANIIVAVTIATSCALCHSFFLKNKNKLFVWSHKVCCYATLVRGTEKAALVKHKLHFSIKMSACDHKSGAAQSIAGRKF